MMTLSGPVDTNCVGVAVVVLAATGVVVVDGVVTDDDEVVVDVTFVVVA